MGAAIAIYAFAEVLRYPSGQLLVFGASAFVALIVGKYRSRLPFTSIEFDPKLVMAFWGTMWMGVGAGVLLGALAYISQWPRRDRRVAELLTPLSVDGAAFFIAAGTYHYLAGYITGNTAITALPGVLVPNNVTFALLGMAAVYFVAGMIISPVRKNSEIPTRAAANLVTAFTAMVLYLVFNHFGVDIGLVILPLIVAGNLAHKVHILSLEQKTRQIADASQMHLATVEALATAIDARDQVGIGHVRRTQIYAVGMGTILGLSDDEINALRTGALLHDIGKLAVPDHILNKPSKLTPAEMEKMKIHSAVGASILEKAGFPYPVVPTVRYHHERWDGRGYPEGLSGTNIPMTARIIAVADAFDTLRGERPYRTAVTRDEACEFLRSRAGTQFDPSLVDLLLRNLKFFEERINAEGLAYNLDPADARSRQPEPHEIPDYVEQIQRANHEVFTLYSLARDFSSSLSLDDTISLFVRKVSEFVPYESCVVYLMEPNGEAAAAVYAAGPNADLLAGRRVKIGEGATGYALKKKQPVSNVDPLLDLAFAEDDIGRDYTTMLCLPLLTGDKLIGAVSLYARSMPHYQDEHVRLLDTVSRIASDAIEKAVRHAEAQAYALTDPLTALPNSRSLQSEFDKAVARSRRQSTNFQLLVLDLDGFKSVNDSFGHKVGDTVLKGIAGVIKEQMREYDFLARYGGDEFVAIVPETDPADVKRLQRRIEDAVSEYSLPVGGDAEGSVCVGVSIGSASYPGQGESLDELIVAADRAMYLTKAINRQRVHSTDNSDENDHDPPGSPQDGGELREEPAAAQEELQEVLYFDQNEALIVEVDEVLSSAAIN
ncbi:MAG TPA: diguanylate cyclase [Pyrinomonadaceae bacterium]|nr:diguanylate cyclase [Pyrinomonadaceae bacterium]